MSEARSLAVDVAGNESLHDIRAGATEALPTYALVTPARNEATFIDLTIRSVRGQTVRPVKWVIVSDGSTDGTDDIVRRHAAVDPLIELVRMPERSGRDFAGKVASFNAGLARLAAVPHDIVGNLDADISCDPDLFEMLLGKFRANGRLGVAGAPFTEGNGTYDFRFSSAEHVSGACQLFRRECFEAIGGYVPLKGGGIDVLAVLSARMKGWETRTFPERVCRHHRAMGGALHGVLAASFALGKKDYVVGRHPLWQLFRAGYQMTRPPVRGLRGLMLLAGYVWGAVRRLERPMPADVVDFQRREQMHRLKAAMLGRSSGRDPARRAAA